MTLPPDSTIHLLGSATLRRDEAVNGLDLSVGAGEVFGLLGPNGAGKTTAIRCITTLLPVPAGMVQVFGHDAARERMAVRRLLGYVPQQLSADAGADRAGERGAVRPRLRRLAAASGPHGSPRHWRRSTSPTPPTGSPRPTPAA